MIAWVTWITWLPARLNPRCGARLLLQRGAARRDVASWRHTQCSPLIGWMGLDPCPSRHSRISRIHGQTTSVVSRGLEVGLVRTGQLCRLDPSFRMPSFILPVLPPPSPAFHYYFPSPPTLPIWHMHPYRGKVSSPSPGAARAHPPSSIIHRDVGTNEGLRTAHRMMDRMMDHGSALCCKSSPLSSLAFLFFSFSLALVSPAWWSGIFVALASVL